MKNQFELVSWLSKDESLITRCIESFMDILVINKEGGVKTTKGFKLETFLNILIHKIELKEISAEDHKWLLLYRVLFNLKTFKEQDIYNFKNLLSDEVRKYLARPILNYVILFPLHVAPICLQQFRSFQIIGRKMFIRSWNYVVKHYSYNDFIEKGTTILILKKMDLDQIQLETRFTPILSFSSGRDLSQVFNQAARDFDLFRFHLNMIYQFYRYKDQFGGYPEPMAKILPPPIYGIFTLDGKFVELFYNTEVYSEYKEIRISPEDFTNARKLARKLGNPQSKKDSKNLMIKAIDLYGQVLDTSEWRLAFLFLWQILELLTMKNEKVSERQVIKRVKSIVNLNQYQSDLLEVIYEKRNLLIHKGKFPHNNTYAQKQVGLLKTIAENLIAKYYSITTTYPSMEDLENYIKTLDMR